MTNPLKERLIAKIKAEGPLSVAEYITICLLDPVHGYYPTRDPLGSDGDFITAPEISQMFGEVIGLWCIQSWQDMGRPETVQLIELGPGRGIMMSDILRAAQLDKGFLAAVHVTLVEASPALEAVQAKTLGDIPCPISWAASLDKAPKGPTIIIGNEFLDCLPIRQFIQKDRFAGRGGWQERMVALDGKTLRFGVSPAVISEGLQATLPEAQEDAKNEDLLEICPANAQIVDQIKQRFEADSGRALFIDYGPEETEFGDTLQALKRHEKVGVFSDPGNTDLTARVDFGALVELAKAAMLPVTTAVPQREFLSKLGLEMRAVALSRAKPESKDKIARQLHRLTASDEMGELFKAICFQSEGLGLPLGFREMA
ncbi:SAM-dependent methyltransferase [Hellea sp.]|nr:SAM-dependent methyltransferase [Hellea sp.]